MNGSRYAVIRTLAKVIEKHGNNFCTARQTTICNLLEKYQGVTIGDRTLRYHLLKLKKRGLIKSIRRTHRNPNGTLGLRSSATCLTAWGWDLLYKMTDKKWYRDKRDGLLKTYWPKIVKIFNPQKQENEKILIEIRRQSGEKLRELLASMQSKSPT